MTDAQQRLAAALTGRYRVEREVGTGGMATVYLAEDLKHHRKVAIKVLREVDDLSRPSIRPDFAAGAGRFFFTVEDRQSDVWVAEVAKR